MPSENISPALGPPMAGSIAMSTCTGRSPLAWVPTWMPICGRPSLTSGVIDSAWRWPSRLITSSTGCPVGCPLTASTTWLDVETAVSSTRSSTSPVSSTPSAGVPFATPATTASVTSYPSSSRATAVAASWELVISCAPSWRFCSTVSPRW